MHTDSPKLPRIIFLPQEPAEGDDYLPDVIGEPAARAEIYERMGDLDRALAAKQEAVRVAAGLKCKRWERGQLAGLGGLYSVRNEHDQAVASLRAALELLRSDDSPGGNRLMEEAVILCALGCSEMEVEPETAVATLKEARARYKEMGDEHWTTVVTGHLGRAYALLLRREESIACFEAVLPYLRAHDMKQHLLTSLNALAGLYTGIRDMPRAIDYAEQTRALAVELGDEHAEREALTLQGLQFAHMNDPAKARSHHERALHLMRLQGDRPGEIAALVDLATAQMKLDDMRGALRTLRELLPMLEETGQKDNLLITHCNLGHTLLRMKQPEEALPHLRKGWDELRASGDAGTAGSVGIDLGNAYLRTRRPREAAAVLEEARGLLRQAGAPDGTMMSLLEPLGEAYVERKEYRSAAAAFEEMLGLARRSKDGDTLNLALTQTSGVAFYMKQYHKALRLTEEQLLLARAAGRREDEAHALYSIGVIHGELANLPKAMELVQAALSIWAELGSKDVSLAREALQAWRGES